MQGTKCDVRDGNDVKNLVAFAQEQLKYIDIWVLHLHLQHILICNTHLSWTHGLSHLHENDFIFSMKQTKDAVLLTIQHGL